MKKSFLLLAVLGGFTGAALAQTNVTVYGVVDAGIAYDNDVVADDSRWRLQSGQQSGSRLGFRGSEDLGGGLKAVFTLENGFNTDTGTLAQSTPTTSRLFGRQAWVGLEGGFGSVKLGRQQTPLYYAVLEVDPFRIGLAGSAQSVFGFGLYGADPLLRSDNTVNYATPAFGGFKGQLAYSFGEVPGSLSTGRQAGVGLGYLNGPINVQFAYHDTSDTTLAPPLGTGVAGDLSTAFIGGSYDFGVAKAHAAFADSEAESPGVSRDNRNWLLGVSAPLGAGTILASYVRNDLKDIPEGKSDLFAIGYTHQLSKRTNFYTSLSYTKNDDNVNLNAFAPGENGRLFNVGVRHLF